MVTGGIGVTKASANAVSKGLIKSVQAGKHQVYRVTNWRTIHQVVDSSNVAQATPNGFINAEKVRASAYVLKPTSEVEKKLIDDIVSLGDLSGYKTEQLFTLLAERSGYKVLSGGKYGANNGFDHVWQGKDGSIVIVDSKQLRNGALQVSNKGAKLDRDFTNQLSENWVKAVVDNLPQGEVKTKLQSAIYDKVPIRTIIFAVDKSDKTVKMIPVKIPNQKH